MVPPFPLTSDEELARARTDSAFRREMIAESLQSLITAMALLKATPEAARPVLANQLREGADLALKLSDILKRLAAEAQGAEPDRARAKKSRRSTP